MEQKKIGSFLRELRKEKGLTQEKLAEQLGVTGRTVSRWETGSNMPDISLLAEISAFYEVSIPELIDGERKSGEMNEEVKEVAEKMSDYAGAEKESILKTVRQLSLIGVLALAGQFALEALGLAGREGIFYMLHAWCSTLVPVSIVMIFASATGLLYKYRKRNAKAASLPAPLRMALAAVIALAAAIVLKKLLEAAF